MARVLGVSTSGYYAWRRRPPSSSRAGRCGPDGPRAGDSRRQPWDVRCPAVHAELSAAGVAVSRKRVARVMRSAGIAGVSRRRGPRTTRRDSQTRPAPDLVEWRFEAVAPNRRGLPTSPTYRRSPASSTWPSSSTCSAGGSWAGRWRLICARPWHSTRWRWRWRNAGRSRSSITRTKAAIVALNPEVGEAGAHRRLEISRAIAADHACAEAARFPQCHNASSSMTHTETTFITDMS